VSFDGQRRFHGLGLLHVLLGQEAIDGAGEGDPTERQQVGHRCEEGNATGHEHWTCGRWCLEIV
jgi:hypothetical protein